MNESAVPRCQWQRNTHDGPPYQNLCCTKQTTPDHRIPDGIESWYQLVGANTSSDPSEQTSLCTCATSDEHRSAGYHVNCCASNSMATPKAGYDAVEDLCNAAFPQLHLVSRSASCITAGLQARMHELLVHPVATPTKPFARTAFLSFRELSCLGHASWFMQEAYIYAGLLLCSVHSVFPSPRKDLVTVRSPSSMHITLVIMLPSGRWTGQGAALLHAPKASPSLIIIVRTVRIEVAHALAS